MTKDVVCILVFTLVFLSSASSSFSAIDTLACNEDLFPVVPYPSKYYINNETYHWSIGIIGSGTTFNISTRFSLLRFAVRYLHNYTSVIPNISVDFYTSNVGGSRTNVLLASMEQIKYYSVRTILGAVNDIEADATAILANEFQVPQLASMVQTTTFSDMNMYPYFTRVIPSYAAQAQVVSSILTKFNWTRAVLLTSLDTFGTTAVTYLQNLDIEYYQISIANAGTDFAMKLPAIRNNIRAMKLVLVFCSYSLGIQLLQALYNNGLMDNTTVYILAQPITQQLIEDPCAYQNYSKYVDGAIGMMPYGGEGPLFDEISQLWANASRTDFPGDSVPLARYWYDFESIYVQAMALQNLTNRGVCLANVSGDLLFQTIMDIRYTGVTGDVFFDDNADRSGNWSVINFASGIHPRAKYIYGQPLLLLENFTFFGNRTTVPVTGPGRNTSSEETTFVPVTVERHEINTGFGAAIIICSCIGLASGIILLWKWQEFQKHGPSYCAVIIVGVLVSYVASSLLLWKPNPLHCMFFPYLIALAFDLVYGCLFIKTWVLYRVFREATKFQTTTMTSFHIIKLLALFVIFDAIFLAMWTVFAFPTVESVIVLDYYVEERCDYGNNLFWIIFLALKALWLLFGVVLSFLTRGIAKEYSESRSIFYAIYHNACLALIGFALGYALQDIPYGITIIEICFVIEAFTFTLIILFLPIWYRIFWGPRETIFTLSSKRSVIPPPSSRKGSIKPSNSFIHPSVTVLPPLILPPVPSTFPLSSSPRPSPSPSPSPSPRPPSPSPSPRLPSPRSATSSTLSVCVSSSSASTESLKVPPTPR